MEKIKQNSEKFDYAVLNHCEKISNFIDLISDNLTYKEYCELIKQLHGTKAEYDDLSNLLKIETFNNLYIRQKLVRDSLYRGIFWDTLNQIDQENNPNQ